MRMDETKEEPMDKEKDMENKKGRLVGKAAVASIFACALVAQGGMALAATQTLPSSQASINGTGQATVTTDARGLAVVELDIANSGTYTVSSGASVDVACDTVGTLYDASFKELAHNDDNNMDTSFSITRSLDAGKYYVAVKGKNSEPDATITVCASEGTSMSTLRCKYSFNDSDECAGFALGTWSRSGKLTFDAVDAGAYAIDGYIDRELFTHAQEDGALDSIKWKTGLPSGNGRFVVKASATAGEGAAFVGSAYFDVDNASADDLAELYPQVGYTTCGAVSRIDLCTVSIVPTNWQANYRVVSSKYYKCVGYAERGAYEAAGCNDDAIKWKTGLPNQDGRYVVKYSATDVKKNPYSGDAYVWVDLADLHHAGAGKWVTAKKATKTKPGSHYLKCKYCKGTATVAAIPPTKSKK